MSTPLASHYILNPGPGSSRHAAFMPESQQREKGLLPHLVGVVMMTTCRILIHEFSTGR